MPCWQELPKIVFRATTRANGSYGHMKTTYEKEKRLEYPKNMTEDYIQNRSAVFGLHATIRWQRRQVFWAGEERNIVLSLELYFEYRERISTFSLNAYIR